MHQVRHLLGEAGEVVVEQLDLARAHPQDRVRVLADLGEREPAARAILRVELPLVDLVAAFRRGRNLAVGHARECSQTVWGSTSTTAFTPARRIAGAAAAKHPPRRGRERPRGVGLRHQLSAVAAAEAEQGRRPEQIGALQLAVELAQEPLGRLRVGARRDDRDQVPERRIAELSPPVELLGEEAGDVVAGGVAERRRVRLERLHDHLARRVAAAAAGELRHELERALLGAEVRDRQPRVRVDDRRERDAGEVVALGDHLRPDQDGAVRCGEAVERLAECARLRGRVRVEPDPLQLRHALLELGLEPLCAGADPRQLGRPALGARVRDGLRVAAVVAVQPRVAVERQGDVAEPAAPRDTAGAAVDRRCQAAAVQEQDRLAALLRDPAELLEQRRRERIARLVAEIDDPDARHRRPEPFPQLEPLEPLPALGPRRGAAVDGDRALERSPLRSDGARVVAWIGLLLVGRVVLLVDADQPEIRHRRENCGACADDDGRLPRHDALALVPALRVGEARVQDRDPVAETGLEAAERLRGQGDLRDEHDRSLAALERGCAGLQVDLGLAAAGRAREQQVRAAAVDRRHDPRRPRAAACPSAWRAPPHRPSRRRSCAGRRAAPAASGRRARAPARASSRSSRRARGPDRRAPAAARRGRPRSAPARRRAARRHPSRRRRPAPTTGRSGSRRRRPSPLRAAPRR